jgi:hypothetical protein
MTVLIYIGTRKKVGDPDALKVFEDADAERSASRRTPPKAWPSNTRFWNDDGRPSGIAYSGWV